MAVSNPGQPDPEVRELLKQLVESQRKTDRWMITLTAAIALLTVALVLIAIVG
jgi:hypothetical protein